MANSATALSKIPCMVRTGQTNGLITPVVILMDTADEDLTIYTPSTDHYACLMGLIYSETTAHSLIVKSPAATTLLTLERAANADVLAKPIGKPLVVGQKSEALIFRSGTAAISSMLAYIMEVKRLDLAYSF